MPISALSAIVPVGAAPDVLLRHPGIGQSLGGGGRNVDRWLEFTGRNDDMLKIAWQWVSTQWVEQALGTACGDSVQELAAVGVKGADGLAAIAAFLVAALAQEETAHRRVTEEMATLPGHKRPRWAHWVDALPRTATGKIRRAAPATPWQARSLNYSKSRVYLNRSHLPFSTFTIKRARWSRPL